MGNTLNLLVIENESRVDDSEMATSLCVSVNLGYFWAFTGDWFNTAVTTVIVKLSKKPSEHREALHHSVGEIEYILPSGFSFVSEPFNLMLSGYCCECPTDTGGEVEVDECRTEHFFAPCAESSTIAKRIQKICLPNTIQVR